ncbi:META domain-containing protein [Rapidithrix thailandica]|uniref:META domain-containing protein n=1 Tax=Rapidithrix thailandica TaxID=413964 RepID=A0AAW9S2P0_9BACT
MKNLMIVFAIAMLSACSAQKKNMSSQQNSEPPYQLHDIWALKELQGKAVSPDDYKMKGVPVLEIYVKEKRYSGHTGCNQLNGQLEELTAEKIKFGAGAMTRMACQGVDEGTYVKTLESVDSFQRKGLDLEFLSEGKVVMIFKKID